MRSSARSSPRGSVRGRSSGFGSRTVAGRDSASWTARLRRTEWCSASIRPGDEPSKTSSSATRRCAGSTSAIRTASTARGCGSRWVSSGSSGSTRNAKSKSTGLPSSRAAAAKSSRHGSSKALTEGSIRLGQWMDWGNDYFTFSDTNIEYIWRFLQLVNERGWLYWGHRSTEWCPRCGTSLSQHELTQSGVYQDRSDPSLGTRALSAARPSRRVARRLDDDALDVAGERCGGSQAGCRVRTAGGR